MVLGAEEMKVNEAEPFPQGAPCIGKETDMSVIN